MSPTNAILLLSFEESEEHVKQIVSEDYILITRQYPKLCRFIYGGTNENVSIAEKISRIFAAMRDCDTMFCDICERETEKHPMYSYIRELARECGLQVISMSDVRQANKLLNKGAEV